MLRISRQKASLALLRILLDEPRLAGPLFALWHLHIRHLLELDGVVFFPRADRFDGDELRELLARAEER